VELFTIHCTTCKARLIVKDESVIGDILACPKCQSMVQVVPPPDWKPISQTTEASEPPVSTTSAPNLPQAQPTVPKPAAKRPVGSPPVPAKSDSTIKAAATVPPAIPPRHTPPEIPKPTVITAAASIGAATDGAPTTANASEEVAAASAAAGWFSALSARLKRDGLLWGGGIFGGVALGAIVWLVVSWSSPTKEPAATDASPVVAAVSAAQVDAKEPVAEPTKAPPAAPGAEPDRTPAEPPGTIKQPVPAPTEMTAAEGNPAESGAAPDAPPASGITPASEATAPQPVATDPQPATTPALRLDPVAQNSLPPNVAVPALNEFAPSAASTEAGPLEPAGDVSGPPSPADDATDPADAEDRMPVSEIERHLSVSLARVEFTETPLGQFAAFLGDVSGVPVILDEPALAKVGKGRRTKISLKLTSTTGMAVLQKGTAAADLQYTIEPGRIVISPRH
jgi:hypothetical protein